MFHRAARRLATLLLVLLLAAADAPAPGYVLVPAGGVTILMFHQITSTPVESTNGGVDQVQKPWTTPAAFNALLTAMAQRGYTFVTLAKTLDFFAGRPGAALPAKPLLITFDDGYVNADTGGTPILRKHHATAVMFFEGLQTGTNRDRLGLAELKAMERSGTWELQSHGWAGHSNILIDAAGTKNPYWYANLAWLPDRHRLETKAEFAARIKADLRHFRSAFEAPLQTRLHVFAYPSGEFGQNAPLPPRGDRRARLEAGHSNADGLEPVLFAALRSAGFDAALAVSIPGDVAPASRANDILALPRLGVGADFTVAALDALATDGFPLPEIIAARFSDPGPIAAAGDGYVLASVADPVLYRLDRFGTVVGTWTIPELLDDRTGKPALIAGLAVDGDTVTVYQQAGTWPGATPRITLIQLTGTKARIISRAALPPALNWLVGIAPFDGTLVGTTDDGQLYDLADGKFRARVVLPPDSASRAGRFAGPLVIDGGLAVYDRAARQLLVLDSSGAPQRSVPLTGDLRNFTATTDGFTAVDWSNERHIALHWRETR